METFISTVVFVLPGFLMYFWIQSFGITPVTKHSSMEAGAIAALSWIPVSLATLCLYNLIGLLYDATPIWTLEELKEKSSSVIFIAVFLVLSVFVSFLMSFLYVKFIYPYQSKKINEVRENRGVAPFAEMPSVWDEVFGGNTVQVVKISKIDNQNEFVIGELENVPRPFETEKCFSLRHVDLFTRLVSEYDVPVATVFVDTKSGMCIKIYDDEALQEAYEKDSALEKI